MMEMKEKTVKDVKGKKLKKQRKQIHCENSTSFISPLVSPLSSARFVFLIFPHFVLSSVCSVSLFHSFFLSLHTSLYFLSEKKVLWMPLHNPLSLLLAQYRTVPACNSMLRGQELLYTWECACECVRACEWLMMHRHAHTHIQVLLWGS